ncbi:MAG: Maf family protein [Bacteroidetes bacterium]|nr:Maf family protein [Bacteroidota bacterium]
MLDRVLSSDYILASVSPRRKYLLRQIGLKFVSVDSSVEEEKSRRHPLTSVRNNARMKSRAVAHLYKNKILLSADTIVVLGKKILNKPGNLKEAAAFLRMLSGKKHVVYTGINVINQKSGIEKFGYEKTTVEFRKLTDEEINFYVRKYKPLDKAGAYGIQDDFGCLFIKRIWGDYYNVVGLPLVKLYELIIETLIK